MVLVVGTVAGVVIARDRAGDNAAGRAQATAEASASAFEALVTDTATALRGVGVIADEAGQVDVSAFEAFSEDLQRGGVRLDLALVTTTDSADEVLRLSSVAVRDGGQPPAPAIEQIDAAVARALGSARRTDAAAVSDVAPLLIGDGRGVVVVRPVIARQLPDSPIVAYVLAELPEETLTEVLERAAEGFDVTVQRDDEAILGPEVDAVTRRDSVQASADVFDLRWSILVHRSPDPSLLQPALVGAAGVVATLAMMALLSVTSRHQRAMRRANTALAAGQDRSRAVQELTGQLAQALTGDEVVEALVRNLPLAVGASAMSLAFVTSAGDLEVVDPSQPGGARRLLPTPPSGSTLARSLGEGEPAWLESPLAWREDPVVAALVGTGMAAALLPISADDQRGVLTVTYANVRLFGDDERALLQTIGLLAERALVRGHLYDDEHRVAVAFQAAALPDGLPDVEGVTVAARYRPATATASVGGDWYDAIVLDERRVLLVVGDVVGHGLVAAATMGRLRTAFQVIAPLSEHPGAMLRSMSAQVDSIPNSFCTTVVCAVIDTRTGDVTWSRAGHPPPVHVAAGGASRVLDAPGLTPLGVVPDVDPPVHSMRLAPGDSLVLYTDGVIERRRESIDVGFDRLALVASDLADLEPADFVEALVEAMVPECEQTDDVAVLVARYDGP